MTIAQKQETWSVDNWQAAAAERRRRLLNPPNAKTELPQERVKPPEFARPVTCYFQPIGPKPPFRVRDVLFLESGQDEPTSQKGPSAKQIICEVAALRRLRYGDLVGPRRHKAIVLARHEAIVRVAKERPHMSLPEIGRAFGGRDHTTILHALRKGGIWGRRTSNNGWRPDKPDAAASAAMCEGA